MYILIGHITVNIWIFFFINYFASFFRGLNLSNDATKRENIIKSWLELLEIILVSYSAESDCWLIIKQILVVQILKHISKYSIITNS